ncbi:hypothetical protein LK537_07835 [Lachnoclostridium pacaense]|uniref:hypothetical protein n=1 Tax=Enterocloster hominis (ex Hitch et al. 2024) TaxID=1917870 RepID=UPI001D104638|nr:hypothetical protein [Lachnoclostridium pacaense]MCC2817196.1 hypothetical protein [Lachnoclostridium pacaense]
MKKNKIGTAIALTGLAAMVMAGCGSAQGGTGRILENSAATVSVETEAGAGITELFGAQASSENEREIDWEAMAGVVSFPKEYLISYDVSLDDGTVITITKGRDAQGNIYYRDADTEAVYVKSGTAYQLYTMNEDGELQEEKSSKYKAEYVEKATKEFLDCAKQNSIMASGSAKDEGTIVVAERDCNYYSVSVGFANFVQTYEYAFDQETGICLAKTEQKSISGHTLENNEGFYCVEFKTSDVKFELPN